MERNPRHGGGRSLAELIGILALRLQARAEGFGRFLGGLRRRSKLLALDLERFAHEQLSLRELAPR